MNYNWQDLMYRTLSQCQYSPLACQCQVSVRLSLFQPISSLSLWSLVISTANNIIINYIYNLYTSCALYQCMTLFWQCISVCQITGCIDWLRKTTTIFCKFNMIENHQNILATSWSFKFYFDHFCLLFWLFWESH